MSRKRINSIKTAQNDMLSPEDTKLFDDAWKTTREHHGNQIVFYLPGMIKYGSQIGRYPAISLTGSHCQLLCEHCKGNLLEPMLKVNSPDELFEIALRLARNGAYGLLLTGGADRHGNLPWIEYFDIIKRISKETDLIVTAHTGFPDNESCMAIKEAGIKQALIDVMGDSDTAKIVYHLESMGRVINSLDCLMNNGIQLAPHIVAGLKYGRIESEEKALKIISQYEPHVLVIVVLTPLKGTPMEMVSCPSPMELARLIARARLLMPETPISLGCERPRTKEGWHLENLAIRAGVTRIAIWSDHAVKTAVKLGLKPRFQATCCSLPFSEAFSIADPDI
jgi:lipoyl synthase